MIDSFLGTQKIGTCLWSRSGIDLIYCGKRSATICVVLGPKKSSMYSCKYTSGFSWPTASQLAAPPSPRHERQCRTGSYGVADSCREYQWNHFRFRLDLFGDSQEAPMREMTALPHASFIIILLDNHGIIVLSDLRLRSSY